MEIAEKEYAKIEKISAKAERKCADTEPTDDKRVAVCCRKWVQMEGTAGTVWEMAYTL